MKLVCRQLPCNGLFARTLLLISMLFVSTHAVAQLEINTSPNVVGSGARALGMGGAFIAIADDATAASWNPGGLTQLERPEISLVLSHKWVGEEFESRYHPELDRAHHVSFEEINYASIVYPIPWTIGGRNLVISLNYQQKYDFDRDLNLRYRDITALPFGNIAAIRSRLEYRQRGSLASISPAFGFELTQRLSLGAVMNLWDQSLLPDNEWEVHRNIRNTALINGRMFPGSLVRLTIEEQFKNFRGTNYSFGAFYRATERLHFGLVYHTKLNADVDYERIERTRIGNYGYKRRERPKQYTFPSAIGVGVAYRFPNDKLTLSLDITRREWDQFIIYDPQNRSFNRQRLSGVTGLPVSASNVKPTYTVRLGGEYVLVNDRKPVQHYLPSFRAGLFYDPEPSGGRKDQWYGLDSGNGRPDDYFGVSVGAGLLIKNRVNLDAAYTYRWGSGVRNDTFGLPSTDADVRQHMFYLSTVIYF